MRPLAVPLALILGFAPLSAAAEMLRVPDDKSEPEPSRLTPAPMQTSDWIRLGRLGLQGPAEAGLTLPAGRRVELVASLGKGYVVPLAASGAKLKLGGDRVGASMSALVTTNRQGKKREWTSWANMCARAWLEVGEGLSINAFVGSADRFVIASSQQTLVGGFYVGGEL
jgi:hypothetical protein